MQSPTPYPGKPDLYRVTIGDDVHVHLHDEEFDWHIDIRVGATIPVIATSVQRVVAPFGYEFMPEDECPSELVQHSNHLWLRYWLVPTDPISDMDDDLAEFEFAVSLGSLPSWQQTITVNA